MSLSKNMGTWDPLTSTRAPIRGDTQVQYNVMRDEYDTAVYDGTNWNLIAPPSIQHVQPNPTTISKAWAHKVNGGTIAANNITTTSFNGTSSRPTISATERELIFDFLKENMRVAEYVDDKGKVHTVQLEMRAGEGYVWENIRRVKTKDPL